MNIYAISDLHLSTTADKPMDIFGTGWEGHFEKIKSDWLAKVQPDDIVLISGDISWAMKMSDALIDLGMLADLPGKKVFIRGNHDYWWNGITKLRDLAPNDSFIFLQTDAVRIENFVIVGSRGWTCPGSNDYTDQDQKLYLREAERFRLAFLDADKLAQEGDTKIALIHYPPFNGKKEDTLFTQLFEQNNVDKVVFGHIHGSFYFPLKTEKNGVEYILASCDKVNFNLVKIY
ncbi:MAG: serine/threonine protein phosphatase [Clostridiales bacterium]|nr:serine/threonine protein phosphatase [Clostridiales bacterium]